MRVNIGLESTSALASWQTDVKSFKWEAKLRNTTTALDQVGLKAFKKPVVEKTATKMQVSLPFSGTTDEGEKLLGTVVLLLTGGKSLIVRCSIENISVGGRAFKSTGKYNSIGEALAVLDAKVPFNKAGKASQAALAKKLPECIDVLKKLGLKARMGRNSDMVVFELDSSGDLQGVVDVQGLKFHIEVVDDGTEATIIDKTFTKPEQLEALLSDIAKSPVTKAKKLKDGIYWAKTGTVLKSSALYGPKVAEFTAKAKQVWLLQPYDTADCYIFTAEPTRLGTVGHVREVSNVFDVPGKGQLVIGLGD